MEENDPLEAFFISNWDEGRMTRPADAIALLQAQPENFLRTYPIFNNFNCLVSGQAEAYLNNDTNIGYRPGRQLGTLRFHTTETFKLEGVNNANKYGHQFPVHGVAMTLSNRNEPAAADWYTLDQTGPALMLTARLTGCTFAMTAGPDGGTKVIHLQPNQGEGEDGLALNERMKGEGRATYGRQSYDIERRAVNIIGVRLNDGWHIWTQKLDRFPHNAEHRIRSVHEIWPI
jgi:hypothetical protein